MCARTIGEPQGPHPERSSRSGASYLLKLWARHRRNLSGSWSAPVELLIGTVVKPTGTGSKWEFRSGNIAHVKSCNKLSRANFRNLTGANFLEHPCIRPLVHIFGCVIAFIVGKLSDAFDPCMP